MVERKGKGEEVDKDGCREVVLAEVGFRMIRMYAAAAVRERGVDSRSEYVDEKKSCKVPLKYSLFFFSDYETVDTKAWVVRLVNSWPYEYTSHRRPLINSIGRRGPAPNTRVRGLARCGAKSTETRASKRKRPCSQSTTISIQTGISNPLELLLPKGQL